MATLSALVSSLDVELRRLGYKDSTVVWYRGCWRRMQKYFAARGAEEFSLDAAMAWVDDACGFFAKEQAGTLKPNDIYMFRVAAMLGEYAAHGAVLRRYNRSVRKVDAAGAATAARFQAHLRAAGRAASTVRTYGTVAGEFVAFTGTRGGLGCCDAATIGAFVATLAGKTTTVLGGHHAVLIRPYDQRWSVVAFQAFSCLEKEMPVGGDSAEQPYGVGADLGALEHRSNPSGRRGVTLLGQPSECHRESSHKP